MAKKNRHSHATYGSLHSCFDLIQFHQQSIPGSPPACVLLCSKVCLLRMLWLLVQSPEVEITVYSADETK